MFRKQLSALLLIVIAHGAYAAHSLVTDDTGTQCAGGNPGQSGCD